MTDERGQSLSVLVTMLVPVMLLLCGFVVDGGGQLHAARRAESVAARASRAGADAEPLGGAHAARARAKAVLAANGVPGEVIVGRDRIEVRTHVTHRTIILSMIGIDQLSAHGRATAMLLPDGPR